MDGIILGMPVHKVVVEVGFGPCATRAVLYGAGPFPVHGGQLMLLCVLFLFIYTITLSCFTRHWVRTPLSTSARFILDPGIWDPSHQVSRINITMAIAFRHCSVVLPLSLLLLLKHILLELPLVMMPSPFGQHASLTLYVSLTLQAQQWRFHWIALSASGSITRVSVTTKSTLVAFLPSIFH